MKTLKKVLSVALVLAMAFSLVTLAGAAGVSKYQDFSDAADIENVEAVDTLVGLGVIGGMGDGTFAPNGYFTRAQAAKMITYMLLGEKLAGSLKAAGAPFADVPVTHWAAPFIQYCAGKGIINGIGDNKFDPEGYVTGAQFAKMLLVAAGYGKQGEFVGADWLLNTIILAQDLGILDTNADYSAPATRDEVARYAFNFYTKVVFVAFNKSTELYEKRENDDDEFLTLAVQQGVDEQSSGVAGGIPMRKWVKYDHNGTPVYLTGNAFPSTNIRVLYSYADGSAFNALTTIGNPAFKVALESVLPGGSVDYYYNGKLVDDGDEETPSESDLASALNSGRKGWVVQLLDTNRNGYADTVVVVAKTVGIVQGAPYITTTKKIIISGVISSGDNVDAAKVVGYEGLQAGDVVLSYKDLVTGMYYIEKAKAVSGQLTRARSSDNTITFAGAVYSVSQLNGAADFAAIVGTNNANFNIDATIYLDNDNNVVLLVAAPDAAPEYNVGVLFAYQYDTFNDTASAKLVKEDGTTAVYAVANIVNKVDENTVDYTKNPAGVFDFKANAEDTTNKSAFLVTYTVNDEGKVTLTKVEGTTLDNAKDYAAKSAKVDLAGNKTVYMNASTKVFFVDDSALLSDSNKIKVTTGYANLPKVDKGSSVYYVTVGNTPVVKAILFSSSASFTTPDPASKYVFVTEASAPVMVVEKTGTVYYYDVYVGDELVSIKAASDNLFNDDEGKIKPGLYKVSENSTTGLVTKVTENTGIVAFTSDNKTSIVDPNYIVLEAGEPINTTSATKYYRYDAKNPDGEVYEDALAVTSTFVDYKVIFTVTVNGNVTAVYFTVDVK